MKIPFTGPRPPHRANPTDAGADLRSLETVHISSGKTVMISTGLSVAIPEGFTGLVFARSGLSVKQGLVLANGVGVIDSDYRGEIKVALRNTSAHAAQIVENERIAQLVIVPIVLADFERVDQLDDTERGTGGFGSTGGQ